MLEGWRTELICRSETTTHSNQSVHKISCGRSRVKNKHFLDYFTRKWCFHFHPNPKVPYRYFQVHECAYAHSHETLNFSFILVFRHVAGHYLFTILDRAHFQFVPTCLRESHFPASILFLFLLNFLILFNLSILIDLVFNLFFVLKEYFFKCTCSCTILLQRLKN